MTAALAHAAPPTKLFPLSAIRLNGGVLGRQQELNRVYLNKLDPDRMLSWFRREAGLEPKAPPYRGWESEGRPLPGHVLGFYLSGASMTVEATGDAELTQRLNYIVDELDAVQNAHGNGYMLALPNGQQVFKEVAGGRIEVVGLPYTGHLINGQFAPTYTLNKLMLGLKHAYVATGNDKAKRVLVRLADWFGRDVIDKLNDAQVQTLLECEHGSLHESFVDVYELTGDATYLRWARRLCHERMLAPLAAGDVDFLTRYHANCQIPKYTGFERIFAVSGEAGLDAAAVNFWDDVVARRSWVIGGNSAGEHFFAPDQFARAMREPAGPESCNSVNMLRLTEALFPRHPQARLIDYYERTLFNHLLAAHEPERGMSCYYAGMKPGTYRVYSDEFDSTWCCTVTGFEVPGKYGQMVYTRSADDSAMDVNLFAPSMLTWAERKVKLTQTTDFPTEPATTLTITDTPADGAAFTLRVRHPAWVAGEGLAITVNGKAAAVVSKPGEYAAIDRTWKAGDVVRIALPMALHAETLPGDDSYVALLYGPVVLSGELGRGGGLTKLDFYQLRTTVPTKNVPERSVPTLVADSAAGVLAKVVPVEGRPLTFRTVGLGRPNDVTLIPFYENHFQRYAVYWRRLSDAEHAADAKREAERDARRQALDARTIDRVAVGHAESEQAHNFKSLRSETGGGAYLDVDDSRWRDARDGGFLSYDVKAVRGATSTLRLTFSQGDSGRRTFDVLAGDTPLGTVSLDKSSGDDFFHKTFPIPPAAVGPDGRVTVRLQARPGNTVGGLFDLRVLSGE